MYTDILPMLYTNVILSQTVLLCVCLSGRSSGFGVGARTRPDRELLSNMEWSLKPLLWLRVNHLYLNPLTCCCISRWYLTATLSITLITDRKCVCFFLTFAVAVNTATVDIIYFTAAVVLQLPLLEAEESTGTADFQCNISMYLPIRNNFFCT